MNADKCDRTWYWTWANCKEGISSDWIPNNLVPLTLLFGKDKDKIINDYDNDCKFKRRKNKWSNTLCNSSKILTKEQVICQFFIFKHRT